uniref:Uncharacterized protein n=1 Tax=Tanacetum cinerariifolium TaxID=118510 RepID=A0A699JLB8_TANCI|nr:hypothetical protein [Tanacetum cinerariifolium]
MSSFNQQECLGCGQLCDGLYCYPCTYQQCGIVLTNVIYLNCIYEDEKPITSCECKGPLRGGFCLFCNLNAENSFTYDPNAYSFNDTSSNFNHLPQPQYETYLCELCGNDSHYGYDCPPQFPLVYEQELSYNQNYNDNYYPHNSQSFLCWDNCGGSHATFQCQPMDQNINSSGFDQIQPSQYPVIHHPSQEMSEEILQAKENIMKSIQTFLKKFNRISFREMPKVLSRAWEKFFEIQHAQPEDTNEVLQKLLEVLKIISEELAEYINSPSWNRPTFYNNDEEHSIQYKEYLENSSNAITTVLPTKEPKYSLSIGDEHLSTILETKSDEVIMSSVRNLVRIPTEYEVTSDNESECDVPVKDESSLIFTTFSNPIFDYNDDFISSDDELIFKEDVSMENFKIYSNPLFDDEEINSNKIGPHYFNAESNLIESLSNRDTLFDSSPKFDYLKEFSGELMPTSIINEERIKRDHEEYISLMEKLLTINSFPCPLENFHANMIIETLPTSPIPVEDSNSLREEIDIFTGTDDFMPPGIESDDYDSEGDIHFLEELLSNNSISLLENESSNLDHYDYPSFPRLPPEPSDVEIFFEPDSGVLTTNVVKGIYEHYVLMPNILPTLPTFDSLYLVYDTLLPFSSENKEEVFKPGILSYLIVSHRDKTTFDFSEISLVRTFHHHPSFSISNRRVILTRWSKL